MLPAFGSEFPTYSGCRKTVRVGLWVQCDKRKGRAVRRGPWPAALQQGGAGGVLGRR